MGYKIWKASIEEYRVQNEETGKIAILKDFNANNCKFFVDADKYAAAESCGFKNSGDPMDYFAWIEADSITVKQMPETENSLLYNPFKSMYFRNRNTGSILYGAKTVVVRGNRLSYQ